jgi:hypothetical protein
VDDQTIIEIQRQIAEVGQTAARMEEKLNSIITKTELNRVDIDSINNRLNAELVPRASITRMGEELAEMGKLVKPAQKVTRWALGILIAALGTTATVYVVNLLGGMSAALAHIVESLGGKP